MMRPILTYLLLFVPALAENKITLPITRYEYAVTANLDRATLALDGVTIAAGADFSLNNTLGPRNGATGYKKAPVFGGGGVTLLEFGGGLCMVSSILYHAFLVAGFEIVERHAHQRVVRYTAPGLDATLDFNRKDLRVKNISAYPVKIRLTRHGKYLTAELSAVVPGTAKPPALQDIRIEREVARDFIPGLLEPGFRVRTMRIFYAGGFPARKEILSEDTFLPIDHASEGGAL